MLVVGGGGVVERCAGIELTSKMFTSLQVVVDPSTPPHCVPPACENTASNSSLNAKIIHPKGKSNYLVTVFQITAFQSTQLTVAYPYHPP